MAAPARIRPAAPGDLDGMLALAAALQPADPPPGRAAALTGRD